MECGQFLGMYTSPCPGAPTGALRHYCSVQRQEVVTHAETVEQHVYVCRWLVVSRLNAEIMRREFNGY